MNKKDLFNFYEKLYFHEIDGREKLNSRLQLPLAIIIGQMGFISYIAKKMEGYESSTNNAIIIFFIILTIVFLGLAIYHFVRSWHNYVYSFLPTAYETEEYKNLLEETYKAYDASEELVNNALEDYIYKYYIKCSSINTLNNDERSINIHKTAKFLIISFVFAIVTTFTHYAIDFNNTKPDQNEAKIISPVSKIIIDKKGVFYSKL